MKSYDPRFNTVRICNSCGALFKNGSFSSTETHCPVMLCNGRLQDINGGYVFEPSLNMQYLATIIGATVEINSDTTSVDYALSSKMFSKGITLNFQSWAYDTAVEALDKALELETYKSITVKKKGDIKTIFIATKPEPIMFNSSLYKFFLQYESINSKTNIFFEELLLWLSLNITKNLSATIDSNETETFKFKEMTDTFVKSGIYNSKIQKVVLTLRNGDTVEIPAEELQMETEE